MMMNFVLNINELGHVLHLFLCDDSGEQFLCRYIKNSESKEEQCRD